MHTYTTPMEQVGIFTSVEINGEWYFPVCQQYLKIERTDTKTNSVTLKKTYLNNFEIKFKFQIFVFSLNNTEIEF